LFSKFLELQPIALIPEADSPVDLQTDEQSVQAEVVNDVEEGESAVGHKEKKRRNRKKKSEEDNGPVYITIDHLYNADLSRLCLQKEGGVAVHDAVLLRARNHSSRLLLFQTLTLLFSALASTAVRFMHFAPNSFCDSCE